MYADICMNSFSLLDIHFYYINFLHVIVSFLDVSKTSVKFLYNLESYCCILVLNRISDTFIFIGRSNLFLPSFNVNSSIVSNNVRQLKLCLLFFRFVVHIVSSWTVASFLIVQTPRSASNLSGRVWRQQQRDLGPSISVNKMTDRWTQWTARLSSYIFLSTCILLYHI